jgi:hypothetical protein
VASSQHGIVTRTQLLAAGLGPDTIKRRLGGELLPVHRGVYRVGHSAPSVEASYMAAVLACGDDGGLSGQAAAHVYGLTRGAAPRPEVTTTRNRRVPGVVVHRVRWLDPGQVTRYRGIPITTVPRTLVDLAAVLDPDALIRAVHQATCATARRPSRSSGSWRCGRTREGRRSCARRSAATPPSPSAASSSSSSPQFAKQASPAPRPTAPPARPASTAAGPTSG